MGAGATAGRDRRGGWQVLLGTEDIVFDAEPSMLWTELEGRAGDGDDVVAAR